MKIRIKIPICQTYRLYQFFNMSTIPVEYTKFIVATQREKLWTLRRLLTYVIPTEIEELQHERNIVTSLRKKIT